MIYLWRYCVDAKGLEGLLVEGQLYLLRELPCFAVSVRCGKQPIVCAASRFSETKP